MALRSRTKFYFFFWGLFFLRKNKQERSKKTEWNRYQMSTHGNKAPALRRRHQQWIYTSVVSRFLCYGCPSVCPHNLRNAVCVCVCVRERERERERERDWERKRERDRGQLIGIVPPPPPSIHVTSVQLAFMVECSHGWTLIRNLIKTFSPPRALFQK